MKRRVQELGLTRKAFSNMRTLVYGIFRYAKKKGYVIIVWVIKKKEIC